MNNGTFWSACAIAALLTASPLVSTAVHAGDTPASPSAFVDLSKIRIGNFGRVNTVYFRGEQPVGRDYADLAAMGIKTVIDLQADGDNHGEKSEVEAVGMKFHRIPMTTRVVPTARQLSEFMAIVTDPARQPVYVHCKGGKHRTGVMTAIYRMEMEGWTPDRAIGEMKRYKFGATWLHSEFVRFVERYTPQNLRLAASPTEPAIATQ
jgi:protein-tyrosine phosphatase